MSADEAELARAQSALLAALQGHAPPPPDVDPVRLLATAAILRGKRTRIERHAPPRWIQRLLRRCRRLASLSNPFA
jgi:hypothetical protein